MAKDTAKKNWKKNEVRMRAFTLITIVVNIFYCVMTLFYHRRGSVYMRDLFSVGFWLGQEYLCLSALKSFAKPVFAADGSLQSCPDASNPQELGLYSFAQDALWVCWVVQALCSFHFAFFVFYLPVPATVIYKLGTLAKPFLPSWLTSWGGAAAEAETAESTEPATREERRREAINRRKGRK